MTTLNILQHELSDKGFVKSYFPLPIIVAETIYDKNWKSLDQFFQQQIQSGGQLFNHLSRYGTFNEIESILAIRSATDDEEGIWHDDGSRLMAFSLGLNFDPESISGGDLCLRKKGEKNFHTISPPRMGELYIFLTGQSGYEHKVTQVTEGNRMVCAGWCT